MGFEGRALSGVFAKLDRAEEHLSELQDATEGFLDDQPCRAFVEPDSEAGLHRLKVEVRDWPPVAEWGVRIGDVVHNLRSALDHLAWVAGGDPPPNEDASGFPIFKDERKFHKKRVSMIGGADQRIQGIIEGVQPYQRGQRFARDPLWHLYRLSNTDKHRLLITSAMGSWGASYWVSSGLEEIEGNLAAALMRPITEDGQELTNWPTPSSGKTFQPGQDFQITFYVAFEPEGPAGGRPVIDELRRIQTRVRDDVVGPIAQL